MSITDLPARPRSAFSRSDESPIENAPQTSSPPDPQPELDKNGRPRKGFTKSQFTKEYWTPERKEEQRQRALAQIAKGEFGAANGFHRRKTKKFQEIAAERAQQKADEIVAELFSIIFATTKNITAQDKLRAIEQLGKFEAWSVQNARDDEKEFKAMSNDQLDAVLLAEFGAVMGFDIEVFDADVLEDPEPAQIEAPCVECDLERGAIRTLLEQQGATTDRVAAVIATVRCEAHREDGDDGDK